jgi:hypothetical protein
LIEKQIKPIKNMEQREDEKMRKRRNSAGRLNVVNGKDTINQLKGEMKQNAPLNWFIPRTRLPS